MRAAFDVPLAPGIAAAAAPATGGASLLASPIIRMILGQVGGNFLSDLLGGGQTRFEGATQQSLAARGQLIGELQKQSAGQPSAASRGSDLQIQQAQNRLQQSYGASAQRDGIAGTTVARAQQGRAQAAGLQAQTIARGNLQLSAQQQLGELVGGAPGQQFLAEQQRKQDRKDFLGGFAGLLSKARGQKETGTIDPRLEQLLDALSNAFKDGQDLIAPPQFDTIRGGAIRSSKDFSGGFAQFLAEQQRKNTTLLPR